MQLLPKALTDEECRVHYSAAEPLGQISAFAKDAVPALRKPLTDGEYRVYKRALKALTNLGASEALIAVKNAR